MDINKNKTAIIIGIILAIGIFYGGFAYGRSGVSSLAGGQYANSQRGTGGFSGTRTGAASGPRANLVMGNIISKDTTGITISIPTGGSRIVFTSSSTSVMKSVAGTLDDLKVGDTVTVQGNTNSANGITADSIQIRQSKQ